jgi:hypothetical protein
MPLQPAPMMQHLGRALGSMKGSGQRISMPKAYSRAVAPTMVPTVTIVDRQRIQLDRVLIAMNVSGALR